MPPTKLAVMISGRGTNLKAILDAVASNYLGRVRVDYAISNKNAPGAMYARDAGIEFLTMPQEAMRGFLLKRDIDLICLAGYDEILTSDFVDAFRWKIMNIHPSLLPSFLNTLQAQHEAVAYGVKISGVTVHFVDEGVDTGPIILQYPVSVNENDTGESLALRILEYEHIAYPKAIKLFSEGRLTVEGRKVRISRKIRIQKLIHERISGAYFEEIGVSTEMVDIIRQKCSLCAIQVKDIAPREAIIIKQEMLALGGDCAVPKDVILNMADIPTDCIVFGSLLQLHKLASRLESQPFNLPKVGTMIAEVL